MISMCSGDARRATGAAAFRRIALPVLAALTMLAPLGARPSSAEVVRLEIRSREPADGGKSVGAAGPFEIIRGLIHGALDPRDRHNTIIQDLDLAPRNARGRVEYVATFALAAPVDRSKAARVLLYQVVNRGNGQVTVGEEGYVSLISGWQGDLTPASNLQTITVPVAKQRDGSVITGPILARFIDVPTGSSTAPIRLSSMGTSEPKYRPAGLSQPNATLTMRANESRTGVLGGAETVPRTDWTFANCEQTPFPGTPDPARICVKTGFRSDRVYELV